MGKKRIILLNDIFDNDITGSTQSALEDLSEDEFNQQHLEHIEKANEKYETKMIATNNKYTFWSRYMGPYAVASSINENCPDWECVVIDWFTKIENFHQYIENFINEDTYYIGLSTTFLLNTFNPRAQDFNLWFTRHAKVHEWFEGIHEINPDIEFILGGAITDLFYKIHFKTRPEANFPTAFQKYINYVFNGYAEDTIVEFLNGELDPKKVHEKNGIYFINETKMASTGAKVLKGNFQHNMAIKNGEWMPIEISKGCRFGCKFCFYDIRGTLIKDADCLREELLYNYENFGVTGYMLTDDTVNDSPEKINMMHNVIKSLPFKMEWISYCRPDMFSKFPEMWPKMIDMGCRGVFLGVETLDHTAGKLAGKGLDPEKIKEIITWMREIAQDDVFILASMIIGLPGETMESLRNTARWFQEQRVLDKIQYELFFVSDGNDSKSPAFTGKPDNPYGIHLEYYPHYYWKHNTMDLHDAQAMSLEWEKMLVDHPKTAFERHFSYNTNFWAYPRLRSLGYDHLESVGILTAKVVPQPVYERNRKWIDNYHTELKLINHVQSLNEEMAFA
tara:strand:- start:2388 stop:4076 length:1689 start_codon:yes stop_codon:yes gene_type:complete